jgi:hypothetical protein
MNAEMERAMNSESLGTRITENGALDQKIWAFKVLGAKWSFQKVLGAFLEGLEWLEGLGEKDRGLCKIWEVFRDFSGILEGLGPVCN